MVRQVACRYSFWQVGALTNLRLLAVVVLSAALQTLLPHVSVLRSFFQIHTMSAGDTVLCLALGPSR